MEYNYRYYSAELGRWLSRDPIEETGGYNLYQMVLNNPLNLWDYLGLRAGTRWSKAMNAKAAARRKNAKTPEKNRWSFRYGGAKLDVRFDPNNTAPHGGEFEFYESKDNFINIKYKKGKDCCCTRFDYIQTVEVFYTRGPSAIISLMGEYWLRGGYPRQDSSNSHDAFYLSSGGARDDTTGAMKDRPRTSLFNRLNNYMMYFTTCAVCVDADKCYEDEIGLIHGCMGWWVFGGLRGNEYLRDVEMKSMGDIHPTDRFNQEVFKDTKWTL